MCQRGETNVLVAGCVEDLEILVEQGLILVKLHDRLAVIGPADADRMGRAVNILDGVLRLDGRLDGELLQCARGLAGLERIDVLDHAGVLGGNGGVAQSDLLIAPGQNGKNLHAQQVVVDVFEETGVLGPAHDVGVDLPGLGRFEHFPGNLLAVHPHGEFVDAGALGNGENIGRFKLPLGVITERLFHARDGHLVFHVDGHLMIQHGQRWDRLFVWNQQDVRPGQARPDQKQRQHRQIATHGIPLSSQNECFPPV